MTFQERMYYQGLADRERTGVDYYARELSKRDWDWQGGPGLWTDLCRSIEKFLLYSRYGASA